MTTVPFLLLLAAITQDLPEVRQLVSFDFLPGKTEAAVKLLEDEAVPIYREHAEMLRFRAYREAESPEPIDLIVVSTFRGMAGMDAFHAAVRESGASLGELYGRMGTLIQEHRDEFVEIDPSLSWGEADDASLLVLVSVRIAAGRAREYEDVLRDRIIPREKKTGVVLGSESGRFLVSNGWHYFHMVGLTSLGDWHRYATDVREAFDLVVESKEIIVAPVSELSVR